MADLVQKPSLFPAAMLMTALVALAGCGDSGPPRLAVWGSIAWKGAPIPRGVVYFDPDVSKGNQGPQGFTLIVDGKYDTRAARSKGCVPGAQIVTIHGFDGEGISRFRPYGGELFVSQQLPATIPAEGGKLDFIVPSSAPPIPKSSQPEL